MPALWIIVSDWSYALAAALFAALTILAARRKRAVVHPTLIIALALTALWALNTLIGVSVGLPMNAAGGFSETMRNAAWLWALWTMLREAGPSGEPLTLPRGAGVAVAAMVAAMLCQTMLDFRLGEHGAIRPETLPLFRAVWLLRSATALGAILLLQGLFARMGRTQMPGTGWIAAALTILWAYEFNHYLLALLSEGRVLALGQMRGLVLGLVGLALALGLWSSDGAVALSRRAAYRLVAVGVCVAYGLGLLLMVMLARAIEDPTARVVQIGVLFALSVIAIILLPTGPFRAWLRVEIAKHLFAHRYDYRELWLCFADALAEDRDEGPPPLARVLAAVAEAASAPAAMLLLRDEDGNILPAADWNWPVSGAAAMIGLPPPLAEQMAQTGWITETSRSTDPLASALPRWIADDPRAWALVPLLRRQRLLGALLIARPAGGRRLDWEDIDMLRVAASQIATTLSEREQQRALAEAQRFDEFNRRFAFILHDIKNLISQIALLAANAERHAENPAFRADMVLTLKDAATRLNDMIARLARADAPAACATATMDLAAIARSAAAARGTRACYEGPAVLAARGDGAGLAQALAHLVQNAVEATAEGRPPVRLLLDEVGGTARLRVVDSGSGMSAAFIRDRLFRPFSSTKPTGFGLGVHEARLLIVDMGGTLAVESREGEGSCFTLCFPLVSDKGGTIPETMRKAG